MRAHYQDAPAWALDITENHQLWVEWLVPRNKCSHRLPGIIWWTRLWKHNISPPPTSYAQLYIRKSLTIRSLTRRSKSLTIRSDLYTWPTHESSIFNSSCAGRCLVIHILSEQAAASQTTILSKQHTHAPHTQTSLGRKWKQTKRKTCNYKTHPRGEKTFPFTQTDSSCFYHHTNHLTPSELGPHIQGSS